MKKIPKCILFDCDGVLVDSEYLAMTVEIRELARLGFKVSQQLYREKLLGHSEAAGIRKIQEIAELQGIGDLPNTLLEDLANLRRAAYVEELKVVQSVSQFLRDFEGSVAIVTSSSSASVKLKLQVTGLANYFENQNIFSIDMVNNGKPDPELYQVAIREMGYNSDEYLAIEDSINGVKSAKAAGLKVWGFVGGKHLDLDFVGPLRSAGADQVIEKLSLDYIAS